MLHTTRACKIQKPGWNIAFTNDLKTAVFEIILRLCRHAGTSKQTQRFHVDGIRCAYIMGLKLFRGPAALYFKRYIQQILKTKIFSSHEKVEQGHCSCWYVNHRFPQSLSFTHWPDQQHGQDFLLSSTSSGVPTDLWSKCGSLSTSSTTDNRNESKVAKDPRATNEAVKDIIGQANSACHRLV